MDLGYAAYMSLEDELELEDEGPEPRPKKKHNYETKWRTHKTLADKVASLAAVQGFKADLKRPPAEGESETDISANAQLNFIVAGYIRSFEKQHGPIPGLSDKAGQRELARGLLKKKKNKE
jgi:hypothetical protein